MDIQPAPTQPAPLPALPLTPPSSAAPSEVASVATIPAPVAPAAGSAPSPAPGEAEPPEAAPGEAPEAAPGEAPAPLKRGRGRPKGSKDRKPRRSPYEIRRDKLEAKMLAETGRTLGAALGVTEMGKGPALAYYPPMERVGAVSRVWDLILQEGLSPRHATSIVAEEMGFTEKTGQRALYRWADEQGRPMPVFSDEESPQWQAQVLARLGDVRLMEAMQATKLAVSLRNKALQAAEKGDGKNARDLAVAYGIAVDKVQLLSGGATSRLEKGPTRAELLREAIRRRDQLRKGGVALEEAEADEAADQKAALRSSRRGSGSGKLRAIEAEVVPEPVPVPVPVPEPVVAAPPAPNTMP